MVKNTEVMLIEIIYSRSVQSMRKWKKHECLSAFCREVMKWCILSSAVCRVLNLADQLTSAALSWNKETICTSCLFGLWRVEVIDCFLLQSWSWLTLTCFCKNLSIPSHYPYESLFGISLSFVCVCVNVCVCVFLFLYSCMQSDRSEESTSVQLANTIK